MDLRTRIRGSLVAIITPMDAAGALDLEALDRLVEWHVDSGTTALVVAGTTGESPTLDAEEHVRLLERAVKAAAGRIPVIAGAGSNSTEQSRRLSERAAGAGVDALMLVVPYYNKPPQRGLRSHFEAIADAVDVPVILYNVPGRTSCDLLPETVCDLSAHPGIIGIKEATGDLARVGTLRAGCPDDFLLLSGDDASARAFMLAGGDGVISVTANIAPAGMAAMCQAALAGDEAAAAESDVRLEGLHDELFVEANPIPVKWALARMGRIGPGIRLPLVPLSESHQAAVSAAMRRAGVEHEF